MICGDSIEEKEAFLRYCRDHFYRALPFPGDTLVTLFHLAGQTPPAHIDENDVRAGQFFDEHTLLGLIRTAEEILNPKEASNVYQFDLSRKLG